MVLAIREPQRGQPSLTSSFAMKSLILIFPVLLGLFCWGCKSSQHPDVRRSSAGSPAKTFKGIELYSWRQQGTWVFALLPGTNREKPDEMVRAAPLQLTDLAKRFAGYAEGENIYWVIRDGFDRPEPAIIRQVQSAAGGSKVNLVIP
jgi:hypothetical protein